MRILVLAFALAIVVGAGGTAAPFESPREPQVRAAELERRIYDLINRERRDRKVTLLVEDEALSRIARAHSRDMAARHFFDHVNPDGQDPTARGKRAGYECRAVRGNIIREGLGENLYQGSLYSRIRIEDGRRFYDWNSAEKIGKQSVEGWMDSPGHRRNILERNYNRTGLGVAMAADGRVYITQLFC
jgi:uncharacterized protein YkwD